MPSDKVTRRQKRKDVLKALHDETGSWGGDAAQDRVKTFCDDPIGASRGEFAYVGALTLRRFYLDPSKPNVSERRSLWKNICGRMHTEAEDPGDWDGDTNVSQLQAIAEGA